MKAGGPKRLEAGVLVAIWVSSGLRLQVLVALDLLVFATLGAPRTVAGSEIWGALIELRASDSRVGCVTSFGLLASELSG